MISEILQALADRLGAHQKYGVVLEPGAVAAICRILEDQAHQAKALEEAADRHFAGHGLPDEVVRIATLLARHGVSAGMPKNRTAPVDREGGAA